MSEILLKDFNRWNEKKSKIDQIKKTPFFHEREIWFISLGENIGCEQNGSGHNFLRPVLVYKKFSKNVFLGIPLTSQKKIEKFYHPFSSKNKSSTAILSQIRLFDAKRLNYKYAKISEEEFLNIKNKLIALLQ